MTRKSIILLIIILSDVLSVFLFSALQADVTTPASTATHCRFDIAVDPVKSIVSGWMDIKAKTAVPLTIYPNNARITELLIDGKKIDIKKIGGKDEIVLEKAGSIRLKYETIIKKSDDNLLSDQDIVLKDSWYPVVDGFCTYEVHAILPSGFVAISEGEESDTVQQGDKAILTSRFDRPYSDAISLIASKRFVVARDTMGDIEIYTYFFKEDAHQSARFIAAAKHYLEMHQSLIAKYPYRRLSIVENSMPSAFSMPTFVLMAQNYIRQEKIEDTALGHEIVHQWFGNSVYADFDKGNWIEGMTIYFADHLYEEQKKEDGNCRKRILIGYENYVRDNNVFSLSKFIERFDFASRSIGYGKAAMVFHMLRRQVGDDAFYKAIRLFVHDNTFRVATWKELENAFSAVTGQDLSYYFQQWVYDVAMPDLNLADVHLERKDGGYEIRFAVLQKGSHYKINVPVNIYLQNGKKTEWLTTTGETNRFVFVFNAQPTEIVLDEYYDVFRRLTIQETPPTIERLITDEKSIIVSSASNMELYAGLAKVFGEKGNILTFMNQRPDTTRRFGRGGERRVLLDKQFKNPVRPTDNAPSSEQLKREKIASAGRELSSGRFRSAKPMGWKQRQKDKDFIGQNRFSKGPGFRRQSFQRGAGRLKDDDLASASLLIIGTDNPLLRRMGVSIPPFDAGFGMIVKKNPRNERKVVAVAAGKSKGEINLALEKITDYRKYSALTFDQGKLISKTIEKADNGISRKVGNPASTQ